MLYPLSYEGWAPHSIGSSPHLAKEIPESQSPISFVVGDTGVVIRDSLRTSVHDALVALAVDPMPKSFSIERPARPEHGDWSTNAAMASAKNAGRNPRELAQELVDHLNASLPAHVESVEIAGPGFVNFRLADTWLYEVLAEVIDKGEADYGRVDVGGGEKVLVEFVSANPTGPLHVGHGRGACYGDSLGRILARAGYDVSHENLLNDRGTQMNIFGASLAARKAGEELPEDGYQAQYIIDWAEEMPADADPVEWGRERAIRSHRETLERINVTFDTWFSERSLVASGAIDATLEDLRGNDMVFDDDGAVWLRSTAHGDDKDRVLVRSNGDFTYLAPDIAYHRDKFERGFERLIDVWGADHHGYIVRMRAALAALGFNEAEQFHVPLVQMVRLVRSGKEVKMGKRSGEFVELAELIDEVGPDATRLTFLLQSLDSQQTFDIDVATSQAMDNPVFYIQYAHARIHQLKAKAVERGVTVGPLAKVDLSVLVHERELDVLRQLFELPAMVELAATEMAPHRLTNWTREMAAAFHGFYHDCRIVDDDVPAELTQARMWLLEASRIGLVVALDLLGVSAPESM